jgi:acyl carrier protein
MTTDLVARGVRSAIAAVLFVPDDEVRQEKELIADLGAESIDLLDLVYRLEDVVGRKVTVARFDRWVRERLKREGATGLTVSMVVDFAREELASAASE